jgi:predicted dehydrogenase
MGMIHYLSYRKVAGAEVVAICETDPVRLGGDWTSIKGNFGPSGEVMDLNNLARYSDYNELLADANVDLIDVCLPPGMHADVTVAALEAGKDVFCEKPIALRQEDGARMVQAAADRQRLLMIGHVLPFFPEFDFVRRTVASGKYGALLGGHFKRVISDPQWLTGFYDPDKIGGPMLDLHIHDAHFIRLLCGMPTSVSTVGRMRGEVAEYFTSQFRFDNDLVVTATSGTLQQQGRGFCHAYEVHLEQATLLFEFAVIGDEPVVVMPVTILERDGSITRPDMGSGDPLDSFAAELTEVAESIAAGMTSDILDGKLARDAITLCESQTRSLKSGATVEIA